MWRPDARSERFTLAVMPDTQYLFDDQSIHPEPIEASFRYIVNNRSDNIVFMAHLGDLTQNGQQNEFDAISKSFQILDRNNVAYSVLAGNHDINSSTDDQRGSTPYLTHFGPSRFKNSPSFGGSSPDGYNTFHTFYAAGREWLVLAMDWRASTGGIAWAQNVMKQHPKAPVILTTHEIVYANDPGQEAQFSDYGQKLWDQLIDGNDQIFLTLNGHFWPPSRTTRKNKAGHDVHLHITNYQNRYYGGAAMIRLYHFDTARNTIDVETVSPWILAQAGQGLNLLESEEIRLTGSDDYFSVPIDFAQRFSGFAPVPPRPGRPAGSMLLPGTVAYWRFDGSHGNGSAVSPADRIVDQTGKGNDLLYTSVPGASANSLTWSEEFHPDQPGHGSLYFNPDFNPVLKGAYFQTGPNAPLNKTTFSGGYTFEAFLKLPTNWDGNVNAWCALLSRWGMSSQAGKKNGDPQEPVVTLSLSGDRELQWCVYPLDSNGSLTNWGHELPLGEWWHVAVVNDTKHTTMYVDGCPVVRNPATVNYGLTTLGFQWLLGGYEYAGTLNQLLYGWIGDVRIVDHALPIDRFMNA